MDKNVHYILSKLKVLSKLQSGQKLMVGDSSIRIMECDHNSWDRFLKWWLGENRHTTLDKLQGFYLEIKDVITALLSNPERHKTNLQRLSAELHSAMRGLNNLMLTYQDDQTVVSQLETLSENFNLEMDRIRKFNPSVTQELITPQQQDSENPTTDSADSSDSSESEEETKPLINPTIPTNPFSTSNNLLFNAYGNSTL